MIVAFLLLSIAADIELAFERMYSFDFASAHEALAKAIKKAPQDPLPYAARSAALLFSELDRMGVLKSEFFASNKRIASKQQSVNPDPGVKSRLDADIGTAKRLAQEKLDSDPDNPNALFAMSMAWGIAADYTALVEKRQFGSLSIAKQSHNYANQLRKLRPDWHDALLTTGLSEYIIGNLPFFVRWFVKFEDTEGNKAKGIEQLGIVARSGRLYKPFAKILLAIVNVREKRYQNAYALLNDLTREFPENPLLREEAARLRERLAGAQ